MAALHRRAAWATYFGLAGAAVAVDLVDRFLQMPIGALNWLFVWLFVQQLGFGVRDQWYSRRPRSLLLVLAVTAYALMAVAVFGLDYDPDMIANLNPPTVLLLLLGLAQVYLFTLLQPAIRAAMRTRAVLLTIGALGTFGMVIYLWHTVAMAVVVGVQLALGLPFPPVLTPTWWITRIPWVLTQGYLTPGTGVAVGLLAAAIGWLTLGGPGAGSAPGAARPGRRESARSGGAPRRTATES